MYYTLRQHHFILLCLTIFYSMSTIVSALSSDQPGRLQIKADSSLLNLKANSTIYQGHVTVDQGCTHITAEKLITQTNTKHQLQEAIAYGTTGNLVHYWTLPKPHDKPLHGWALVIKYYPQRSMVYFMGDAKLTQGDNTFKGPNIYYNLKKGIVFSPSSSKGRSTITLSPNTIQHELGIKS